MKEDLIKRKPISNENFSIFLNNIADIKNIKFGSWSKFNIIFCNCFKNKNLLNKYYQRGKKTLEHEFDVSKIIKQNIIEKIILKQTVSRD